MSFKVLHKGYQHIRLSSSFSLTLDIQDYLRSLARDEKGIESIQFYMDQQHFTLRIKEGFSVLDNAATLTFPVIVGLSNPPSKSFLHSSLNAL